MPMLVSAPDFVNALICCASPANISCVHSQKLYICALCQQKPIQLFCLPTAAFCAQQTLRHCVRCKPWWRRLTRPPSSPTASVVTGPRAQERTMPRKQVGR
eukprot:3966173-Pleurochrysis_carterae.AAC.1